MPLLEREREVESVGWSVAKEDRGCNRELAVNF